MRTVATAAVAIAVGWAWAAGAGCAPAEPGPAPGGPQRVSAFVSIPPLGTIVERVGGDRVTAGVLVPPGQSPHAYEPTPKQMTQLGQAKVFFAIGWPFEKRLLEKLTAANPGLLVVDLTQGLTLRTLTTEEQHADEDAGHAGDNAMQALRHGGTEEQRDEGTEGRRDAGNETAAPPLLSSVPQSLSPSVPAVVHPPGEPDPHVWLSPRNIRIIAATVERTLHQVDPAHADRYAANLKALQDKVDAVDARIAKVLAPLKDKEFFVFHPAFGYFGDAYGLKQVPVEIQGKEPGARQLAEFISRAKARGVKVIFVQPQFSAKSAEAVAREIGGAVVPMDDLARDTLANLEEMAGKIQAALGAETPRGNTK